MISIHTYLNIIMINKIVNITSKTSLFLLLVLGLFDL